MKLRKLDKYGPSVEGRDSPNWMIVDCQDIIVELFSPSILFILLLLLIEAREVYQLEDHWEGMRIGEDRYFKEATDETEEQIEKLMEKYALKPEFFDLLDDVKHNNELD